MIATPKSRLAFCKLHNTAVVRDGQGVSTIISYWQDGFSSRCFLEMEAAVLVVAVAGAVYYWSGGEEE